jgi:hypothetical protein
VPHFLDCHDFARQLADPLGDIYSPDDLLVNCRDLLKEYTYDIDLSNEDFRCRSILPDLHMVGSDLPMPIFFQHAEWPFGRDLAMSHNQGHQIRLKAYGTMGTFRSQFLIHDTFHAM